MSSEDPLVLSLDAGGSNFVFSALQSGTHVLAPRTIPVDPSQLETCLEDIIAGFEQLRTACPRTPEAISFAFPGPANYAEGIIYPLANLPAFDRHVALGPMLEQHFGIPVFINNDGDLFAYGEGRAGFLPYINGLLASEGSTRRCRNLVALTLGTGLGCGVYLDGTMLRGDNDAAAEIWGVGDHRSPGAPVEETVSIRGLRRAFAEHAGISLEEAPDPRSMHAMLTDAGSATHAAASYAFATYYDALTEVLLTCIALFDGIVVLGGGIAGSAAGFLPRIEEALNRAHSLRGGGSIHRLESTVYNLSDPRRLQDYLRTNTASVRIPGSDNMVSFVPEKRSGIAVAAGDTSASIMKGAYFYALDRLRSDTSSPH